MEMSISCNPIGKKKRIDAESLAPLQSVTRSFHLTQLATLSRLRT